MLNKTIIHGAVVRQPELRQTKTGTSFTNFTVAVQRTFAPKGQDKVTDYFDCTAWARLAEVCNKHLDKGSEVMIMGRMESNKWEDKDGNKRISWSIQIDELDFGLNRPRQQAPAQDIPHVSAEVATDFSLPF